MGKMKRGAMYVVSMLVFWLWGGCSAHTGIVRSGSASRYEHRTETIITFENDTTRVDVYERTGRKKRK